MVISLVCTSLASSSTKTAKIRHVKKIAYASNDHKSIYLEFATSREALPMAAEILTEKGIDFNNVIGEQGLIINNIKEFTVVTR